MKDLVTWQECTINMRKYLSIFQHHSELIRSRALLPIKNIALQQNERNMEYKIFNFQNCCHYCVWSHKVTENLILISFTS